MSVRLLGIPCIALRILFGSGVKHTRHALACASLAPPGPWHAACKDVNNERAMLRCPTHRSLLGKLFA